MVCIRNELKYNIIQKKVINLIKNEIRVCTLAICGNYAGGYMVILIGCKLKAGRIFRFLGQFSCENHIDKTPLLKQFAKDCSKQNIIT